MPYAMPSTGLSAIALAYRRAKGESLNVYSVVYVPVSMSSSTSWMLPVPQPTIWCGLGWAEQSYASTLGGGDGGGSEGGTAGGGDAQ